MRLRACQKATFHCSQPLNTRTGEERGRRCSCYREPGQKNPDIGSTERPDPRVRPESMAGVDLLAFSPTVSCAGDVGGTTHRRWYARNRRWYAKNRQWYARNRRWYAKNWRWYARNRRWYAKNRRLYARDRRSYARDRQ